MKILQKYFNDRNIVEEGCDALKNLAVDAETNSEFGNAGICPLLMEILQKHLDDRDVIYTGCRALCNLAENAENKSEFRRVNI